MGAIKGQADSVFRSYVTDGVPGSGNNGPDKSEIRSLFATIDTVVGGLTGSQVPGYIVFDTLAHLNAALAYAANAGAAIYNDTVANNGIYAKVGASGSGSWTRLGPLPTALADIDFNVLQSRQAIIPPSARPVLTSGLPGQYPDDLLSTFSGWATPIACNGETFNAIRVWFNIEQPGHPIRVSVWNASKTLIAQADAVPYTPRGHIDVRVPAAAGGGASVLWCSIHVPDGATRLRGWAPPSYANVASPATYPQLYVTTEAPTENLSLWSVVAGNVGFPIAFALYNYLTNTLGVPDADTLAVAPRLFGIVGLETNVYFAGLRCSGSDRAWNVDSVASLGAQQDERWTFTPTVDVPADLVTVECYHPDNINEKLSVGTYTFDAVTMTAAAGAARRVLLTGDSLSAMARYQQRAHNLSVANASAVQITWVGTLTGDVAIGGSINTAALKHEGRGGYAIQSYYQPSGAGVTDSPFSDHVAGHKFDASYYLSSTGFTRPDIVVWELGINDVFSYTEDWQVHSQMDASLSMLDQMIGIQTAGDVGSWLEVSGGTNIAHLIFVPPAPAFQQAAFGLNYGVGQFRARYLRNIGIARWRIIDHYRSKESNRIYLIPTNAVVDPVNGYPYAAAAAASSQTARTIERQTNGVHPLTTGVGGFEQMGDQLFAAINALVVRGRA